jgi:hypothetical protein
LRIIAALIAAALVAACGRPPREPAAAAQATAPAQSAPPAQDTAAARPAEHLRIEGTGFRTADGRPFEWRGITAFRLVDQIADGDEAAARSYLAWAKAQKLTVVRVLAMGSGWLDLKPEDGRRALPRLLSLAREHDLHVEVVALAGTLDTPVNLDEHVTALGRIVGDHPNALLEIANEPAHPTQAPDVWKPDVLMALAARVPAVVPVALGSIEGDEGFGRADYVTWHSPRDNKLGGWGHVLAVAAGAELVRKWAKPVIGDEPIGAGPKYEPGRRDDQPARFRAGALLTRLAGLGATFHYASGLQASIPRGRELECFNAWNEAWTLLPTGIETQGTFAVAGNPRAIVRDYDRQGAYGVFERVAGDRGWILAIGPGEPALELAAGWKISDTKTLEGARLLSVGRS